MKAGTVLSIPYSLFTKRLSRAFLCASASLWLNPVRFQNSCELFIKSPTPI
jgi:hypothetical protein